jgi:hypothetical protein
MKGASPLERGGRLDPVRQGAPAQEEDPSSARLIGDHRVVRRAAAIVAG